MDLACNLRVTALDHDGKKLVLTSGKKVVVYQLMGEGNLVGPSLFAHCSDLCLCVCVFVPVGDGLAAAVQSTFNGENVGLSLHNESVFLAVGDVIKVLSPFDKTFPCFSHKYDFFVCVRLYRLSWLSVCLSVGL